MKISVSYFFIGATASQPVLAITRAQPTTGDDWEMKLLDIERNVKQKSNENRALSMVNTTLEGKCLKLQQELTLLKLQVGEQIQADDDSLETRDLHKRCGNLETDLRRKTRELDLLRGKIQNQTLLEEELGTANVKLKLSQDNIEKLRKVETCYSALLEEKHEWSVLFQGIILENENIPSFGTISELRNLTTSQNINPSAVLRALGSIQMKYVLLLKSQSEFESSNIELRRQLETSKSNISKFNAEKNEIALDNERVMSRLRLAQRQTKLFEGEVSSLRSLLSSFDVEFSIGRPPDETLFEMKDRVIAALQSELDLTRSEGNKFAGEVQELERKMLSVCTTSEGMNEICTILRTHLLSNK